jgi:signal transduction histidine kinase
VAEEELFRVVQKAMHNSLKQATPQHIDVHLARVVGDPGILVVEVDDDGVGFSTRTARTRDTSALTACGNVPNVSAARLEIQSSSAGSRVWAVLPAIPHTIL